MPSGFDINELIGEQSNSIKQKKDGYSVVRLNQLLTEPDEKFDWVIDELLISGGISILAGKPKAGKSTLARVMALNVSTGRSCLDRNTTAGPVLYLALEEKRNEVKRHFVDMGATGIEPVFVHAGISPKDAVNGLRNLIDEIQPVLVIIDPLFRFLRISDSNDYLEVTLAMEQVLNIARTSGCHLMTVHHLNKQNRDYGDGILGSQALFGAVDCALILNRSGHTRTLKSIQRYGPDLEQTVVGFDEESRTVFLGEKKTDVTSKRIGDLIIDCLAAAKMPLTEPEILERVSGSTESKRQALRDLVSKQYLVRTEKGARGRPYLYAAINSRPEIP